MSIFRTLHRSFLLLFAIVVISIITLAHYSISKIVAEQSRAQQKSISPALSLIVDQLIQPLHIAQTLAKSREIKTLMSAETVDERAMYATLTRLADEFGLSFFIANDNNRKQYISDGSKIELLEGQVSWYFKYKDRPETAVADIGKWEDVHFYIDLKIFDDNGKFLGFFGVGKRLNTFLNVFEQYKLEHGYDFIFVDTERNITLSSDESLLASNSNFKNLSDLSWFDQLTEQQQAGASLNNLLIEIDGQDQLIAEVNIEPFDWTLYLLTPLQARQSAITHGFIVSIVGLLIVIFALFFLIYNLLYYYRQDMQKSIQVDPLTKLPNRNRVELQYAEVLDKKQSISVILIDIDHFKAVNDTHGHNAGDNVLRQVATALLNELREQDTIGRWGGEEFVVLLPETSAQSAFEVAQKLRKTLANMTASTGTVSVQVTASFGVAFTDKAKPLNDILASADDALYQAKRDGRNLVRMQISDAA